MAAEGTGSELVQVVALLGAGVVAVPLFQRLGLGSVLGYLAAGLAIGPFGLGLFSDPQAIIHTAELGVVMFLFVIGLEMQPSHLWHLRKEIFGLGVAQVAACGLLLTGLLMLFGLSPAIAFVGGMGFVLTSTAVVMQVLEERREVGSEPGQRVVSILLLEDLAIVPLLAAVTLLSPDHGEAEGSRWVTILVAAGSLAALLAAGRWLLNPLFLLLAESRAREVMTAAALLVVLGAALAMQLGGLSMAMGAFLAGVLLSESSFRHQLEADIEPFRGILLGLFFMGVGMSIDLALMARQWPLILAGTVAAMAVKGAGIYAVARLFGAGRREAADRAALMAQGGEFAFVLYAGATSAGVLPPGENALLTASVILSMALTPLVTILVRRALARRGPSLEGVEEARDLKANILMIGFGRFGQVASQALLDNSCAITIIDSNPNAVRESRDYGFKLYYGDGTRPEVLHAAGAGTAKAILVCVDDKAAATRITELVKAEYPRTPLLVRAYDRLHAVEVAHAGADYHIRDTFESAMRFGEEALRRLDLDEDAIAETMERTRRRDEERHELELVGGLEAGRRHMLGNTIRTEPAEVTGPAAPGS
ncbi:monovalent cation:proton antiporter-2 (CPA2) family protein [Roseomonas sp. OT10]|uniref:monovalent cation:proton antiporter-2 (CPA2) family protein n=1 Tax=Roseomonas cutis TaxID=2897332 RepID=UPI001E591152|nr:monovalent cation:proton antiporter-2 (CPA2) family protein [Roseomonas sp. OT10]UFN50176.1 monovalent cation:proton antiporter-2 (CPA2) family protein [Roseomonas sp. OT10]